MIKIKDYEHTVQYYETDKMAIVHHSNYIRWFEESRVDLLEQLGIGYFEMEQNGVMSPVLSVECEYKSMTVFGDTVIIRPTVKKYTGVRLYFEYEVLDKKTKELRCIGKSSHCFLDNSGKPVILKKVYPKAHDIIIKMTGKDN